jgi:hypothetical protein
MALNTFKTRTKALTTASQTVYTAPENYTSIIIMAQVSNIHESAAVSVTVLHRDVTAPGVVPVVTTDTQLVQGFNIPVNDSASVITGKLVLEQRQSVVASASADSSAKIILSILETLNG